MKLQKKKKKKIDSAFKSERKRKRRGKTHNADGLISHPDVLAVGVSSAVDGHGLDAHLLAGLHDAAGDLTAVGNQNLVEGLFRKRHNVLESGRIDEEEEKEREWSPCHQREQRWRWHFP